MSSRTRHADTEIDLAADGVARAAVDELSRGESDRRLEAANRLRHAADSLVTELVVEARIAGATWADVGEALGVSTQAAHQKYRWSVEETADDAADTTSEGRAGTEEDLADTPSE
jgi:hypothetical protein